MRENDEIDAMAVACIEAGRLVTQSGSPALRSAMRVALFILGRELAGHTKARNVVRLVTNPRNGGSGGRT